MSFIPVPHLSLLPAQVSPISLMRARPGLLPGTGWWTAVVHAVDHVPSHTRGRYRDATIHTQTHTHSAIVAT